MILYTNFMIPDKDYTIVSASIRAKTYFCILFDER